MSKNTRTYNVKPLAYYVHVKIKIWADFQVCNSVPLMKCSRLQFWKLQFNRQVDNAIQRFEPVTSTKFVVFMVYKEFGKSGK